MNKTSKSSKARSGRKQKALTLAQKRQVRAMISASLERKSFYTTTGSVAVTTAGTLYCLSSIAQGHADTQRVGDELHKKTLEFMYHITVGATGLIAAADQYNTVRLVIFIWHEDNGLAAPTPALILQLASATSPTSALSNYDTKHLYKILSDEQHVVYNTPIWNGAAPIWYHGPGANFAPIRPRKIALSGSIEFDADTVVGEGHVYALVISDSAFTPNPTIELNTRLDYDDG
jgi:hypothetical protein